MAAGTLTDVLAAARPNRLVRALRLLEHLPAPARRWTRNRVLRRAVPLTGTAKLDYALMTPERVEIAIANRHRVQNHIQGIHAAAMALLAETATGMVVGMNVRDDCVPVVKQMRIDFKKRAVGALRAIAVLTPEQRVAMQQQDKGDISVAVQVIDESGAEPIACEFIWAWIPAGPRKTKDHPGHPPVPTP